ncbi:MAG: hypothetical protein WDW38_008325 [Sanguina aurantia]
MGLSLGPLPLIEQQLSIAGSVFSLVAPQDVDAVMDMYIDKGCTESDPYWARAWPSAVALATQILQRPELVRGARVVELGAGLGLAGMAALRAGAREVVLLDREPLALQCALLSARASGLGAIAVIEDLRPADLSPFGAIHGPELASFYPPPPTHHPPPAQPAAPGRGPGRRRGRRQRRRRRQQPWRVPPILSHPTPLVQPGGGGGGGVGGGVDGGSATTPASSPRGADAPAPRQRLSAQVFDWDDPGAAWPRRSFDVVLACDVLYEPSLVDAVARVVPRLTVGNRERFLSLLARVPPSAGLSMGVDENYLSNTDITKLDNELVGGCATEVLPVQLLLLRSKDGHDSVGVK